MTAVQDQVKPKIVDVPGSARALSTALEQKLEGNVFYKERGKFAESKVLPFSGHQ